MGHQPHVTITRVQNRIHASTTVYFGHLGQSPFPAPREPILAPLPPPPPEPDAPPPPPPPPPPVFFLSRRSVDRSVSIRESGSSVPSAIFCCAFNCPLISEICRTKYVNTSHHLHVADEIDHPRILLTCLFTLALCSLFAALAWLALATWDSNESNIPSQEAYHSSSVLMTHGTSACDSSLV